MAAGFHVTMVTTESIVHLISAKRLPLQPTAAGTDQWPGCV